MALRVAEPRSKPTAGRKSKTGKQRVKRPDTRRQELLDAALQLYLTKGYAESTVADVTNAAKAAKGTFYRYFDSKDDLLAALRQRFNDELVEQLTEAVERISDADWESKLDVALGALLDFSIAHADIHDVLFHSGDHAPAPTIAATDHPVIQWFTELIIDGCADGAFHVADPEYCALLLFSAFHGSAERLHHASKANTKRFRNALLDVFRRSLLQRPASE